MGRNKKRRKRLNQKNRFEFIGSSPFVEEQSHQDGWNGHQYRNHFNGMKDLFSDLKAKGLYIRSIIPDGNCLFRACADQLFGDQHRYKEVRNSAIKHMVSHKDDYTPFMDETQPFNEYIHHMRQNGVWGGDLELNAISNSYKCNIIVYQDVRPNIELQNYPEGNCLLKLAYFGRSHYNSVRGKNVPLSKERTEDSIVLRKEEKVLPPLSKPPLKMMKWMKEGSAQLSREDLIKRNQSLLRRFRRIVEEDAQKPVNGKWRGDLPFDELVTKDVQEKVSQIRNPYQVVNTMELLTKKCPCQSGSYFKYCCYPKIKACIKRKRYYLSKYRV